MYFQSSFFMPNGSVHLPDAGMASGNSLTRGEQKRGHQWLVEDSEMLFFASKRQAIQSASAADSRLVPSGAAYVNSFLGSGSACYQSLNPVRIYNISDKNSLFNISDDKNALPLSGENPLLNLSLSHPRKDLGGLNAGAREGRGWNFSRRSDGFNLLGHPCMICDDKMKSIASPYEKFLSFGGSHLQAKENFTSSGAIFASGVPFYHAAASKGITYGKGKEAMVSMVGNYPKGNLVANNNFMLSISSAEGSNVLSEITADQVMNVAPRKTNGVAKPKRVYNRKASPYCFPTNVKNLLSTGIFEGVPVKYVSWSRGKMLKGIIKGTHYLCGCDRCKMRKKVNAYEFEQHAGCDTKHPNNHIYFPCGMSLYTVVQKLKGFSNEKLFDAIKAASGTPINIKNFRAWKALYESTSNSLRQLHLD